MERDSNSRLLYEDFVLSEAPFNGLRAWVCVFADLFHTWAINHSVIHALINTGFFKNNHI